MLSSGVSLTLPQTRLAILMMSNRQHGYEILHERYAHREAEIDELPDICLA